MHVAAPADTDSSREVSGAVTRSTHRIGTLRTETTPPSEVRMSVTQLLHRTTSSSQAALLLVLPHGGQNLARRNAWASMSVDADRARARTEAADALSRAAADRAAMP